MLEELSTMTNKFIDDVKKRVNILIESSANLTIENGKKRLDELHEILKAESDLLEERIKIIKNCSIADVEQAVHTSKQKIMLEKTAISSVITSAKNDIDEQMKNLKDELSLILNNGINVLQQQIQTTQQKIKDMEEEMIKNLDKKFIDRLDQIIIDNKSLVIKSIISAIFKRKKG
jgi:polyhydroxyalkanoate synthesis regulator phasin